MVASSLLSMGLMINMIVTASAVALQTTSEANFRVQNTVWQGLPQVQSKLWTVIVWLSSRTTGWLSQTITVQILTVKLDCKFVCNATA
jgi:hypothetical protein